MSYVWVIPTIFCLITLLEALVVSAASPEAYSASFLVDYLNAMECLSCFSLYVFLFFLSRFSSACHPNKTMNISRGVCQLL
mmetsp:Transcript_39078/g.80022  ORF Transcript_39078/g.80022 Transcript_39078/m.80022 type:complete len:81 (+) Transcript_39078:1682-1924(+)